ncbi:hypothetical protein KR093_011312 [Drosophila rubida]|uniref:Uncharacterized protein n=1 Tax=Drosophila rubida TaxID=30044 RepID=A0AAD4PPD9_9MUSC|nr:hypothetical protein KR093_011312 [Drosophila rubida]
MRKRDILRLWSQIVHEIGRDKYTYNQWQEIYNDFMRCMYAPSDPYIRIQSVEKLVADFKQRGANGKGKNTSGKVDNESLPILKSLLQSDIKEETVITPRRSRRQCVLNSNNNIRTTPQTACKAKETVNGQHENIESTALLLQKQIQTQIIKEQNKGQPMVLLTRFKQPFKSETLQTKKLIKKEAKVKRIKSEGLTIQPSKVTKQTCPRQLMIIDDSKAKTNYTKQQQTNHAKLKSPRKRQSKSKMNVPTAHMPPTAINLTREANFNIAAASSAVNNAANEVAVENLSCPKVRKLETAAEQSYGGIRAAEPNHEYNLSVDAFNQLLADEDNVDNMLDKAVDVDANTSDVDSDDGERRFLEYLQRFSDKTASEIDRDLANSTQYFDHLASELADKTPSELAAILEQDLSSTTDQNGLLENDLNITVEIQEENDIFQDNVYSTMNPGAILQNDLYLSSQSAPEHTTLRNEEQQQRDLNSRTDIVNFDEQRMLELEHNLTTETPESFSIQQENILQNNLYSPLEEDLEATSQNDLGMATETASENSCISLDLNLTTVHANQIHAMTPQAKLHNNLNSSTGENELLHLCLETKTVAEAELNFTMKKEQSNMETVEQIQSSVLQYDLDFRSERSNNVSFEEQQKICQDKLTTTTEHRTYLELTDKTPLEQEAIMQDDLNFEVDSEDVLSVATSWDGDVEDDGNSAAPQTSLNNLVYKAKNESVDASTAVSTTQFMSALAASTPIEAIPVVASVAAALPLVNTSLSALRSFRIPKQTNKPKIQLETEQHQDPPANGQQQQQQPQLHQSLENGIKEPPKEVNAPKQPGMNGNEQHQRKQQQRDSDGNQQQQQRRFNGIQQVSLVNGNRQQLRRSNAQPQPIQEQQALVNEQHVLRPEQQPVRPTGATVPEAAPIFAPPYQRPEQTTSTSSQNSIPNVYRDGERKNVTFGIRCWKYLDDTCTNDNCNHQLSEIGDVLRRLDAMTKTQLIRNYNFVLRHGILFEKYFVLFATIFGSRRMPDYLVKMVNDCCLYMEFSASIVIDIFKQMLHCEITTEAAAGFFMKYLWQSNMLLRYPELTNQLLKILSIADWYNYMPNLEELFDVREFPIPLEFGTTIAQFAAAQQDQMIMNKVCKLMISVPIAGSSSTLTSVARILFGGCLKEPNESLQGLLQALQTYQQQEQQHQEQQVSHRQQQLQQQHLHQQPQQQQQVQQQQLQRQQRVQRQEQQQLQQQPLSLLQQHLRRQQQLQQQLRLQQREQHLRQQQQHHLQEQLRQLQEQLQQQQRQQQRLREQHQLQQQLRQHQLHEPLRQQQFSQQHQYQNPNSSEQSIHQQHIRGQQHQQQVKQQQRQQNIDDLDFA